MRSRNCCDIFQTFYTAKIMRLKVDEKTRPWWCLSIWGDYVRQWSRIESLDRLRHAHTHQLARNSCDMSQEFIKQSQNPGECINRITPWFLTSKYRSLRAQTNLEIRINSGLLYALRNWCDSVTAVFKNHLVGTEWPRGTSKPTSQPAPSTEEPLAHPWPDSVPISGS